MIHAVGRASHARAAPDRPHLGRARGAARHAGRQGHLLRHRRPRHQAAERHADHEEGHGRCRRRPGARPHDHGAGLDVRLRILIPAAENSISGNAFRPGDVLKSRAGKTVEIGNTDAEGRLVLADALALADEDKPDTLLSFATLTGAARVALGPDLPPFFTDDDALRRGRARRRHARRRSGLAHAVLVGLRGQPRQCRRRHEQRLGRPVRRRRHRRAVPAPLRQTRPPLWPFRHLRLAAGAKAARPQGRRGAGRARRVRHAARAGAQSKSRPSRDPPPLDKRRHRLPRRPRRRAACASRVTRPALRGRRARAGHPLRRPAARPPRRSRPAGPRRRCSARSSPSTSARTAGPGCSSSATTTSATCATAR